MALEEKAAKTYQACRDHVREAFHFRVKYRVICQSQYERTKAEWEEKLLFHRKTLKPGDVHSDSHEEGRALDSQIMAFLLEMDEKLDLLIAHMSGKEKRRDVLEEGVGLELSGGGMQVRVEKPVAVGELMRATLLLSRFPFVRVQVLAKVIHVKPRMIGEEALYDLGVQFLYLDDEDRERIIACVFQRQRQVLRRMKGKDGVNEEVIQSIE